MQKAAFHLTRVSPSVFVFAAGDRDSKWSVHYTSQKPQQGLRFIPGKRRSGSADDLRGEMTRNNVSTHLAQPIFSADVPEKAGKHKQRQSKSQMILLCVFLQSCCCPLVSKNCRTSQMMYNLPWKGRVQRLDGKDR